ncbi:MAG: hypothetical protein GY795_45175 [Desulfobacterales bacterium]|nr:hypothetical protein [Desulfobacterales bacterium]
MKISKVRSFIICIFLFIFSSCGSEFLIDSSIPVCQIIQKEYENGWKICGKIIIYQNKAYSWTEYPVWKPVNKIEVFSGKLKDELFDEIVNSLTNSEEWKSVYGIATFIYYIDDSKLSKPKAVEKLIKYLEKKHPVIANDNTVNL